MGGTCEALRVNSVISIALIAALVSGCNQGDTTSTYKSAAAELPASVSSGHACEARSIGQPSLLQRGVCGAGSLVITGAPRSTVLVNTQYEFRATATADGGKSVSFAIENKPDWAGFDASTGTLSGVPTAADVGTYTGIVISASDGRASAALPAFSITVAQSANGSVTVSWMPPTSNSDGTQITNLAGYRINYGTSPDALVQSTSVDSAGLTSIVLNNLTPGTWYLAIRSVNGNGVASNESPVVSFTVSGS